MGFAAAFVGKSHFLKFFGFSLYLVVLVSVFLFFFLFCFIISTTVHYVPCPLELTGELLTESPVF